MITNLIFLKRSASASNRAFMLMLCPSAAKCSESAAHAGEVGLDRLAAGSAAILSGAGCEVMIEQRTSCQRQRQREYGPWSLAQGTGHFSQGAGQPLVCRGG